MLPTWLKWIELNNPDQLTWIGAYLADKGYPEFAPREGYLPDGLALIEAMARHEQDSAFRYWADKMRAAWRQKQYRARNGQQVAFQLPKSVQMDLARLAKARGQTKVETLRQVISDSAREQDHAREEVKKIREKRKQDKTLYHRISDSLLEVLAEELHRRCRLEALIGGCDDTSLEGESLEAYHALVDKRLTELEAAQQDMNLARPGGASLRSRMRALA
ncbi:hypothetical protein [Halomonas sp.]|uniref:hypothetical protein n=1 Tax=Halomonas sp. TaxID=1486246 RepID=UPI00356767BD